MLFTKSQYNFIHLFLFLYDDTMYNTGLKDEFVLYFIILITSKNAYYYI